MEIKMRRQLTLISFCAALSACGATTVGGGNPVLELPGPATFTDGIGSVSFGGGGYTFGIPLAGASVSPQAQTLPTPIPTAPPATGTATMVGRYDLVEMTDFQSVGGVATGTPVTVTGDITILADFQNSTISNVGGPVTLNGTYTNQQILAGTSGYKGAVGTMKAIVGQEGALGVFQGNDGGSTIYAGGFAVID
jgi:hypothetical protein